MPNFAPIPFDPAARFPAPSAPGLAARAVERWRLWRQHRRWIREMSNIAALGGLDAMLGDVGLSRADLAFLIGEPEDAGHQFQELARMEQVDLSRERPETLRQATWACAHCACRTPCRHWLRTGEWTGDGDARCPNAALFRH